MYRGRVTEEAEEEKPVFNLEVSRRGLFYLG